MVEAMLSGKKLSDTCKERKIGDGVLAEHLTRGRMSSQEALAAVKNWKRGLYTPLPTKEDVERLASALGVEVSAISEWRVSYRYAPMSASKVRLVTDLVAGRDVQDALDLLTFTNRRAAPAVKKLIQSAVANADEQEADVDNLFVMEARVDQAGRRIGTKAWFPKDRGRAHPIRKQASHIHITVAEASV
ncbi:MAG: 50S ribosomal protein L22 [Planctomycetaceae bacterium]|nr:50S ribosomal protein L22 [Planctomycetaceae bacterium]